ncbi:SH3 domain-containing protein [Jannaschia faecimaris]|uniref:SH3 domain-containing protein n=1 Tax=Jannaschia faecimaris TaxID=1244108 RepID=A0A1H3U133_9RHOB|nr:SH3 domain-containing protein [Jannaschia faecimaris]SDZ56027.1 SH3 domain-containing protein [Jannaschia faecimaris]
MFKMTFALAVALYSVFVIWGTPSERLTTERGPRDVEVASATVEYDTPVMITSQAQDGAAVTRAAVMDILVPDAATVAASAPAPESMRNAPRQIGEPVVVSLVQPDASSATATESEVETLYIVSGSRVNLRSGPSTADAVIDSLPGGTLTQIIGQELDGWIQVRDVTSGLTGYMAARFLEPA